MAKFVCLLAFGLLQRIEGRTPVERFPSLHVRWDIHILYSRSTQASTHEHLVANMVLVACSIR